MQQRSLWNDAVAAARWVEERVKGRGRGGKGETEEQRMGYRRRIASFPSGSQGHWYSPPPLADRIQLPALY